MSEHIGLKNNLPSFARCCFIMNVIFKGKFDTYRCLCFSGLSLLKSYIWCSSARLICTVQIHLKSLLRELYTESKQMQTPQRLEMLKLDVNIKESLCRVETHSAGISRSLPFSRVHLLLLPLQTMHMPTFLDFPFPPTLPLLPFPFLTTGKPLDLY